MVARLTEIDFIIEREIEKEGRKKRKKFFHQLANVLPSCLR
jgi:hypothetical protein